MLGLGDLITVGCLMMDCSDRLAFAQKEKLLTPTETSSAPVHTSQWATYKGIGYSKDNPDIAKQQAMASVISALTVETGFELGVMHNFINTSRDGQDAYSAVLKDSLKSFNFLSGGEIVRQDVEQIEGGYQAVVIFRVSQSNIKDMQAWSQAIRAIKFDRIQNPYLVAVGKIQNDGSKSPYVLERIARMRAMRDLAEQTDGVFRSSMTLEGDELTEDVIRLKTRASMSEVETVSVEHTASSVVVQLRTLNPFVKSAVLSGQ